MDGRRRRLGRRPGGAGAVREGTGAAVAWDCVFVDAPTDLRFEGDLCTELARVNICLGPEPSISLCPLAVAASRLRFEGELLAAADPVTLTFPWRIPLPPSSALYNPTIFPNPHPLLPFL